MKTIQTHAQKVFFYAKGIYRELKALFLSLSKAKQIAVSATALLIVVTVINLLSSSSKEGDTVKTSRSVTLSSVSDLANSDSDLPLLGTVASVSEATIRTESSGKLTRVYQTLGDYVTAGQVIAEFENSGERASLLQAEGAYDAAKAARDIAKINNTTASASLLDTKTSALNTLSNAYTSMDDAVRVKTDQVFSNPRNSQAKLLMTVPDANLQYSLESQRKAIETMLIAREAKNRTLTSSSDLTLELSTVQQEAQTIKTYLDDLAQAYAKAVPDTGYSQSALDGGKTSIGIARASIGGTISSAIGAKTALTVSVNQEVIGRPTSIDGTTAATDAQLKQAEGVYNAALSRLQKTIIRSPISGTLNSLSIQTGDFVTQFSEIAVVSNNGALEILAYVTEDDAKRITVGSTVSITPNAKGIVTRVASALDPKTKKIEVRIGITDKESTLVNGQSVRVSIEKRGQKITKTSGPITIPLSALKITPKGSFVFTVDASSTLVALKVQEGALLGDKIQILSGLSAEENIVTDARGLKEGVAVTVSTK